MNRPGPVDESRILEVLRASKHGPMKAKQVARTLDLPPSQYKAFRAQLRAMEGRGVVYRVRAGRYAAPERISLVSGRVSTIRSGDAFIRPDETGDQDVFVRQADLETAMHGDRVMVRIESRPKGRNPVGRVIRILERAHPTVVGTFRQGRKIGYVVPLDARMGRDIMIPWGDEGEADEGDVVVVRIVAYGARQHGPTGEVERVLGPISDPGVDVLAVLFGHGLPLEFDPAVEAAAEASAARPVELTDDREDWRDRLVVTIDPSDARDHDDALSLRRLDGDRFEVGVHIADVSYYVPRGSAVDLEALNRGTSVYLVDRVVPMLPHALSSGACSLRPGEDRLAVTMVAVLDGNAEVIDFRFARTVVRSRHRLDYQTVAQVLAGEGSVDAETDRALRDLDRLARHLRARRDQRGSIDFDLPEARVILDDEGAPVDIQRVERLDSHRLVEDYMLLANELVAESGIRHQIPILYRIHESPTAERTETLREFLATLGHTLPRRALRPQDLKAVLERVRGRPEEALVSTVVLRSMQRARYAPDNLGHFGLALENYAHFTSPIRRYPDLVTHRALVRVLLDGRTPPREWVESLAEVADRSSWREEVATQAERDSIELKKIEFMERHLGAEFEGTVAGVTSFGFFVLLDRFFVEGLVHVSALDDDYYEFHEVEYALVGSRRGRRFRLGDRVRVQVARTDKVERKIDFHLVEASARGAEV